MYVPRLFRFSISLNFSLIIYVLLELDVLCQQYTSHNVECVERFLAHPLFLVTMMAFINHPRRNLACLSCRDTKRVLSIANFSSPGAW